MEIPTAVAVDDSNAAPPRRKMKTAATDDMSDDPETLIPETLILETIVPYLPIKSAVHFQTVSKPWNNFIKHPFFTRLHLSFSQSRKPTTFLILSVFCYLNLHHPTNRNPNHLADSARIIEAVSIDVDRNGNTIKPSRSRNYYAPLQVGQIGKGDMLWHLRNYFRDVIGVCCGVFCVTFGAFALLWNPAIQEVKVVEFVYCWLQFNEVYYELRVNCIGFGAVKDAYGNVVNFKLLCKSPDYQIDAQFFSVYSLNTNKWNFVEYPSFFVDRIVDRAGRVYLNGVLYWLAWGSKAKESAFVLTFDLISETLGRIELPTLPGNKFIVTKASNNFLSVFGGQYLSLAVATEGLDGTCVDVWVLIDEGGRKRWKRVDNSIGPVQTKGEYILGYWADGNAIISKNGTSLNFHTADKCSKLNTEFSRNMACLEYFESFVSPNRISKQDDFQDID